MLDGRWFVNAGRDLGTRTAAAAAQAGAAETDAAARAFQSLRAARAGERAAWAGDGASGAPARGAPARGMRPSSRYPEAARGLPAASANAQLIAAGRAAFAMAVHLSPACKQFVEQRRDLSFSNTADQVRTLLADWNALRNVSAALVAKAVDDECAAIATVDHRERNVVVVAVVQAARR